MVYGSAEMTSKTMEDRYHRGLAPRLPDAVWQHRIGQCRDLLARHGVAAGLVYSGGQPLTGSGWARYFANFVHSIWNSEVFILIPVEHEPVLILNYQFMVDIAKQASSIEDVRAYKFFGTDLYSPERYQPMWDLLTEVLGELNLRGQKIGLCFSGMQGNFAPGPLIEMLRQRLPTGVDLSREFMDLLLVKTDYDIAQIRTSCEIGCRALTAAYEHVTEGSSPLDAFGAFIKTAGDAGAEFPGIFPETWHMTVKGGVEVPNRPFWLRARRFVSGDMVPIDTGTTYNGYPHDMGRTGVVGKPTRDQQRLHDANWEAHQRMRDALRPGVKASEISLINFAVAKERGYEKIHDLQGHGIGFFENESPILVPWSDVVIRENMVINIECLMYVPNFASSLIEDTYLVTKDGAEWLTESISPALHVG
jgi:Xaa-Pro aminopeptidase